MDYRNPDIESSYRENDLGRTLYDLVLERKPKKIVEIGALYGYSAVAMAMALDEIGEGHLTVYDLFDDYQFKHGTMKEVQRNLEIYGVQGFVTLVKKDFEQWIKNPEPFDLLHLDISNKGDIIDQVYAAAKGQIADGSIVVFEGGTDERDQVEWMRAYKQKPIRAAATPFSVIDIGI